MSSSPKRILISTFGSLGDLHPYIAIALELKRRGHTPVIASFDLHRPVVVAAGLEFSALRPGLEVFGSIESVAQKLFGSWRGAEYMVREIFMKHLRDSYADTLAAAHGEGRVELLGGLFGRGHDSRGVLSSVGAPQTEAASRLDPIRKRPIASA